MMKTTLSVSCTVINEDYLITIYLLVAFMLVEATVLFFVPDSILASISWYVPTGAVVRPSTKTIR